MSNGNGEYFDMEFDSLIVVSDVGYENGYKEGFQAAQDGRTDLVVTKNGEYTPSGESTGFKSVRVNVPSQGNSGGGGVAIKNQDITITENGTYIADEGYTGLGTVTVDVQSGGGGGNLDAIWEVDGTTPTEVHSNATSVRQYAFYKCPAITVADFPKATSMEKYAFSESGVTVANFPELLSVADYTFNKCQKLKSANVQKAEVISKYAFYNNFELESIDLSNAISLGDNALYGCRKLKRLVLPKLTTLNGSTTISNCNNLLSVDMHSYAGIFASQVFSACYSLKALILRSETMCALSTSTVFDYCYHMLGAYNSTYNPHSYRDGCIYVPRSLIDGYRQATNWSKFGTQFRVLEDFTVDGTIMGEIDTNKVGI
jgi:hypothetical protein